MDLSILDKPIHEITGLPVSALADLEAALDTEADTLKRRKEAFAAVLTRRFGEQAQKQLVADGKDTGTVNIPASNSMTLKVEFKKAVVWDQKQLAAALNAMSPEDARHYGKVTLGIDERKFTAAPPAVQAALRPARTVKVGKPSFTFKDETSEAA